MSYVFNRSFPATRLRRLRYNDNIRAMVQEVSLELKAPHRTGIRIRRQKSTSISRQMPGVERLSVDLLIEYAKQLLAWVSRPLTYSPSSTQV